MELFTSSDMKHQREVSRSLSQSLSVNGPLGGPLPLTDKFQSNCWCLQRTDFTILSQSCLCEDVL